MTYKTIVTDKETGKEFTFTGSRKEVSEKASAKFFELDNKGHAVEWGPTEEVKVCPMCGQAVIG